MNLARTLRWLAWMIPLLVAVGAGVAVAGARSTQGVSITTNAQTGLRTASGALGPVRRSSDSVQYIGCTVHAYSDSRLVSCFARNAAGETLTCHTDDEFQQRVAGSLNETSSLLFSARADGSCERVIAVHRSSHL